MDKLPNHLSKSGEYSTAPPTSSDRMNRTSYFQTTLKIITLIGFIGIFSGLLLIACNFAPATNSKFGKAIELINKQISPSVESFGTNTYKLGFFIFGFGSGLGFGGAGVLIVHRYSLHSKSFDFS